MAQKSNKSCERKQQADPSKVSEIKSVDKCIQELDLTREELSFSFSRQRVPLELILFLTKTVNTTLKVFLSSLSEHMLSVG